jgi:hypothetical protein
MKRQLCILLVLCGLTTPCLASPRTAHRDTLQGKSLEELHLMRNEIFARHGKPFKDNELDTYFAAQRWYKRDVNYDDSRLSETEKVRVRAIDERERELLKQNYLIGEGKRRINFGNIINKWQFGAFSTGDIGKLCANGFVIVPAKHEQFFHLYEDNEYKNVPSFVTTDAVLQLYHMFFNLTLRNLETEKLLPALKTLTEEMLKISREAYRDATVEGTKQAALRNLAYFTVPERFLTGDSSKIESSVSRVVSTEIDKCENAEARENSLIFNPEADPAIQHDLDYTQFIPRGHYTRSEELQRYFKAMMWFGLNYFLAGEGSDLIQSLAITEQLYDNGVDGKRLIDLWSEIYEPTSFYVGLSDDLTPTDYRQLMDRVFGGKPRPEDLINEPKLTEFRRLAGELWTKKCKIRPQLVEMPSEAQFRFMGQRYIPDSEILQRLSTWPERPIPKGLDVLAVLGSQQAKRILLDDYKEKERWVAYPDTLDELIREFGEMTPTDWRKNLYHSWVWCLKALAQPSDEFTYPFFMQNKAWELKNLNTSLASWAELRHDAILYGKQSGAEGDGAEWYPNPPKGYVEPNVLFYRRLGELLSFTRQGLESRGLLTERMEEKFKRFMELVSFLEKVSVKELANQPLTNDEYDQIKDIGALLENLTIFVMVDEAVEGWYEVISDVDRNVAVVADVHTSQDKVLEEGVGPAFEIYTIVEVDGYLRLTRGAVFSYYEFVHPASDRLTDEKWQLMLKKNEQPPLPDWTREYLSNQAAHGVPEPGQIFHR